MHIDTPRFRLRPLTVADVSETYLEWFRDPAAQHHIQAADSTRTLDDLRAYIRARQDRADVLFLGIFEAETGLHVGNIKFEPVDTAAGTAVMGILIGEPGSRGKGAAAEVLRATGDWLRLHRGIRKIVLGVSADNTRAIRAYESVGFMTGVSPLIRSHPEAITMIWSLCEEP